MQEAKVMQSPVCVLQVLVAPILGMEDGFALGQVR